MKKEIIVAVLFGILFGGVAALVLLIKNKEFQLTTSKTIAPSAKVTQAVKNVAKAPVAFEVTEPATDTVVSTKNVQIKGRGEKGALLVVQSAIGEVVRKNSDETFSIDFPVALGENVILVSMYPPNSQGKAQEKEIKVYYIEESL